MNVKDNKNIVNISRETTMKIVYLVKNIINICYN